VKRIVRSLALLLIALIPLQGMAASVSGICMAFGHHETAGTAASGHPGGHAHDSSVEEHHHEHDAGAVVSDEAHCPPCVACGAATAISPSSPVFVAEFVASPAIAPLAYPFSGVQPEALDRPPLAL
jgi:hypothetical protein